MTELERMSMRSSAPPARHMPSTQGGILQRKCACGGSAGLQGQCDQCQEKQKGAAGQEFHASWGANFGRIPLRSAMERAPGESSRIEEGSRFHTDIDELNRRSEQVKKKEFLCPPVADTVTNINSSTGGGGTIGLTKIDKASQLICPPATFDIDAKAGTCSFKPVAVSLSLTSKFSAATATPLPTSDTLPVPGCGNKQVPIFMQITKANSDLARDGEKEHCDDLNISFAQTIAPCAAEVNKLAGQKLPGKTDKECEKALINRLGFDPYLCTEEFADLTNKDTERDVKGFHDFDPVLISKDCNKIVSGLTPSSTNKINDKSVAPSKFIPASTKCAKPAAAKPATPSGSGSGSGSGGPPPVPAPAPTPKKEEKKK